MKTPVLIVGGGPAGLILSLDLSRRGVPHVLINDRAEPAMMPKLDVINTRSMEIFRSLGVADAVRAAGLPTDRPTRSTFQPTLKDEPILTLGPDFDGAGLIPYASVDDFYRRIRDYDDGSMPAETNAIVSQMYLEPVLKSCAETREPADIRFGHSLIDFEEHLGKVVARVRDGSAEVDYTIEAEYLVACDGAQSPIRTALGIGRVGAEKVGEMTSFFIESEDVSKTDPLGPAWHAWTVNPDMLATVIALNIDANYFNIHAFGRHNDARPTLETIFGKPFDYSLLRQTHWFINLLVADSYGTDRVFLAGDAAHQFFPTYGLGCNTAAIDATNLGWKIAAVVQGWGGPDLLRSYEREMLPLAQHRVAFSGRGAEICQGWHSRARPDVMHSGEEGDAARRELARVIADIHPALYGSLGLELGYRYAGSPAISADGTPEPPNDDIRYLPTTWPGARLPHVFLRDGSSIYDHLSLGFTIITCDDESPQDVSRLMDAARALGVPISHLSIREPRVAALYERAVLLVRPDQHVAWRSDGVPDDASELIAELVGRAA